MTFIGFVLGSGGVNLLHCEPKSGIPCTAGVLYISFPHLPKKIARFRGESRIKVEDFRNTSDGMELRGKCDLGLGSKHY